MTLEIERERDLSHSKSFHPMMHKGRDVLSDREREERAPSLALPVHFPTESTSLRI